MYEVIDEGRIVKARKRRRCEWCPEWIEVGDECVVRTYKVDGELNNSRQHPECYEAMRKGRPVTWEDSFEFGEQLRGKTMEETEEMRYAERMAKQEKA